MSVIESGRPVLIKPGTFQYEGCCDCNLVHLVFYRLRRVKGKLMIEQVSYREDWETEIARKNSKNR